jgi:hypothetical protein
VSAVGCDLDGPGREQRDGPREQPMLDGLDPLAQARLIVAGQHRDGLLRDDRPAVERLVDEVDGDAGDRDAVPERIADGVRPGERRQQRRMRVQDPPAIGVEHGRPDDPHVAGEHDQVGRAPATTSASAPSSPPATSAVSIPCSAAQSSAGHARSAKTRTMSPPRSPRREAAMQRAQVGARARDPDRDAGAHATDSRGPSA